MWHPLDCGIKWLRTWLILKARQQLAGPIDLLLFPYPPPILAQKQEKMYSPHLGEGRGLCRHAEASCNDSEWVDHECGQIKTCVDNLNLWHPTSTFATCDLVAKVNVGDACHMLSYAMAANFAEVCQYDTVTVGQQPRHSQYLWECINIRELEVSWGTHPKI